MSDPYADAAPGYLSAGWSPIPLPYRRKAPPLTGTTGYAGVYATEKLVAAWSADGPHNVGLRLPETILGLDVDAYGDKGGAGTLAEHEERLGELPPTWRSTARHDDPVSGIRFYRVPAGRQWRGELDGGGVEVIHHGHRFAVAWPSVHPKTGDAYGWYDPDGDAAGGVLPSVEDFPALPEAWVAELGEGELSDRDVKADLSAGEIGRWLAALPDGEQCRAVAKALYDAEGQFLLSARSRHGVALQGSGRLVRFGEQGHRGAGQALEALEKTFYNDVAGDRTAREMEAEWSRMVSGAVAMVVPDPTAEADRGCCPERSTAAEDFAADNAATLFEATDTLRTIRQHAHARGLSAPALLGCVLGRVLAEVPPETGLPDLIGHGSLNIGIAMVGDSGWGKTSLITVSRRILGFEVSEYQQHIELPIGSGEGITEAFLRTETRRVDGKSVKVKVLIDDPRRILVADEVDQIAATQDRSGSTLASTIRSAVSGGRLGQQNADAERRRNVHPGTYRLTLLVGVQPTRSGVLLNDADAGTPQRFLWVPLRDSTAPGSRAEAPELPGALDWTVPDLPDVIQYPDHIKDEVLDAQFSRHHSDTHDELAGHARLTRLKVAAGLALLHDETAITDQWWDLAGVLTELSQAVQEDCRGALSAEAERRHTTVAIAKSRAEDAAVEDRVTRAGRAILRTVKRAGGAWVSKTSARPRAPLRPAMDDAIELLRLSGQVKAEERKHKGSTSLWLRYVGGDQ